MHEKQSCLLVGYGNAEDFAETGRTFDVLRSTLCSKLYVRLGKDWLLPRTHTTGRSKRHESGLLVKLGSPTPALSDAIVRFPKMIETLEASLNGNQTPRWPMK